ncbi:MAG: hypothetical protein KatS3mg105_0719 [Gemmatales bacterium]|nr:MAG: hypothetical protein KatS3mg105_0719 [Gemmatales bacterium]
MRRMLIVMLPVFLAGCLTNKSAQPKNWLNRFGPFRGPTGPDVVVIDAALLQCTIGDHYINRELWTQTDEQVVEPEKRAMLDENGLRVGQVGGITPPKLLEMLTSERTCVNPRRIMIRAGHSTRFRLGPTLEQCRFVVKANDKEREIDVARADCSLVITATLTPTGETRLRFTPEVQHGDSQLLPAPADDRSGWELKQQRPTESFPALSWEVTLAPNEYLIVGAQYDRPGTLGHECFIQRDKNAPGQRLLVLRTGRAPVNINQDVLSSNTSFLRAPPIAFQASRTAIRGQNR